MNLPPSTDAATAPPYIAGVTDLEPIGHGGFGTVFRGRQTDFNRTVAIKMLNGPGFSAEADRRFRREVAAMGAVSHHPNVVPVYATGMAADGRPYLVMPYLPGGTLADRLGTMPWPAVVELGSKMAGALQAAHDVGVLHRDVKPANILWSAWDEPQLADFGIARLHDATRTAPGSVAASLWWAAPELLEGRSASPASDVYALAASLHASITGRSPHSLGHEESMATTVARIASSTPADLNRYGVPAAVSSVIAAGLAKDPAQRPATARAFGDALVAAAITEPSRDRDPTPVPAVVPLPLTDQATPAYRDPTPPPFVEPVATAAAAVTRRAARNPWAPTPEPRHRISRRRSRVPAALLAAAGLAVVVLVVALLARNPVQRRDGTSQVSAGRSQTPATTVPPTSVPPVTTPTTARPAPPTTPRAVTSTTTVAPTTAPPTTQVPPRRVPATTAVPPTSAPNPPTTFPPTTFPPTTFPPAPVPSTTGAPPPAVARGAPQTLTGYYGLLAQGSYDTSWRQLTPAYQQRTGGFGRYTGFWKRYRRVDVFNIRSSDPLHATATLTYVGVDGKVTTETDSFTFAPGPSGTLLIDDLRPA